MADQRLILDSAEAVELAAKLCGALNPVFANGTLPEGLAGEQHVIVFGRAQEWVDRIDALQRASGSAIVRPGVGDFLEIDQKQPFGWLRDRVAKIPSSAPQPKPPSVASPVPESAKAAAAESIERAESDSIPSWHSDIPDDYPDEPSPVDRIRMASNVVHLRAVEDRPSGEWPEPVNFWTKSPLPAFDPLWIIPQVRPFVLNQAAMVGCDPGITWLQTVAFAAGCLSDDIRVRVRPLQPWAEAARLWVCVIGDSGDGKSPSMSGVMRESRDLKMQIAERSKLAQAGYKDELDLHELERREWLSRRQKMDSTKPAGQRPTAPPKPVNELLYFSSTTSEGLLEQQEATTRGTMCYADEFLGWLMGMDQYKAGGRGSDRQFWLSAWDGAEFVGILVGKLRTIPNTGVNIIGGSQPGAFRRAVAKMDLDSDGLLQRVLVYNSQGEASEDSEQPADLDAVARWKRILHGLYNMKTHLDHCVFSEQSHAIRREANDWIKQMRGINSFPVAARQALSKWRAYLPRIALTLHAIEAAEQGLEVIPATIEEHTIATAWEYMRGCLWPHLLQFYETITEQAEDRTHLIAFANYVLGRDMREVKPAYLSSKWTHYQRKIKTIQERREFWASVVQAGWARPAGGFDKTGNLAAVYELNPLLFDGRFSTQIEAAEAQIEKYREIMHPDFRQHRQPGED